MNERLLIALPQLIDSSISAWNQLDNSLAVAWKQLGSLALKRGLFVYIVFGSLINKKETDLIWFPRTFSTLYASPGRQGEKEGSWWEDEFQSRPPVPHFLECTRQYFAEIAKSPTLEAKLTFSANFFILHPVNSDILSMTPNHTREFDMNLKLVEIYQRRGRGHQ